MNRVVRGLEETLCPANIASGQNRSCACHHVNEYEHRSYGWRCTMTCPKCRLESVPSAQRCDCGYDFESGEVKESYFSRELGQRTQFGKADHGLLFCGWLFSILGGFIGLAIAY